MKRLLLAQLCLFATGCTAQPESIVPEIFRHDGWEIFNMRVSVPETRPSVAPEAGESDLLEGERLANVLGRVGESNPLL